MFRIGFVCFLGCGAATLAAGHEDLVRSEVVSFEGASVVSGEVRAGDGGSGWKFRQTPRGVLIYLVGSERSGAWGGWYLNYDHRGKDRRVGLVPEPGPGCYWTWSEGARKKNVGGFGYTIPCTARPANGPLRGWSLTLDGGKPVLAREPATEARFIASIDDLSDGK